MTFKEWAEIHLKDKWTIELIGYRELLEDIWDAAFEAGYDQAAWEASGKPGE